MVNRSCRKHVHNFPVKVCRRSKSLDCKICLWKNKNCKILQTQHKDINECICLLVTSGKLMPWLWGLNKFCMGKYETSVIKSSPIFKGNLQDWNFFWCIQLITCWKLVHMLKKRILCSYSKQILRPCFGSLGLGY